MFFREFHEILAPKHNTRDNNTRLASTTAGYGCTYMLVSVAYEYVRTHPQKRTQMMY